jgi:hypothetical protein
MRLNSEPGVKEKEILIKKKYEKSDIEMDEGYMIRTKISAN